MIVTNEACVNLTAINSLALARKKIKENIHNASGNSNVMNQEDGYTLHVSHCVPKASDDSRVGRKSMRRHTCYLLRYNVIS